jgi:beta-N-acetylhexosaminidase
MVGFEGAEPTAELEGWIEGLCPGGVILFARNVSPEPEAVAHLISRLQAASLRGCGLPLLVAIDQEGGPVARLRGERFTHQPSQAVLGGLPVGEAERAVREQAARVGAELNAVGINLNLAPVLDVRTRPDSAVANRCFSEDAGRVAALGVEAILGLQEAGVAACAKHFPGHGDTRLDSHRNLPAIAHGLERLEAVELVPYRAAIEAGVAAVMTTHILYRALDAALPATLSAAVVGGLLRERLGFTGLVLSDDLQMGAIINRWGLSEAAELALRAGCDQLLVCNMLRQDDPGEVARRLAARAREDEALAARLAESAGRLSAAKERWAGGWRHT